jgi:hypothetical protein
LLVVGVVELAMVAEEVLEVLEQEQECRLLLALITQLQLAVELVAAVQIHKHLAVQILLS